MDIKKQLDSFFENETVKAKFVEVLSKLIAVPSVVGAAEGEYVFGKPCADVLTVALDIGKELGFRTENHEWYCGSIVLDGKTIEEMGIVGHLDVVPAFGEWEYPKYELTVDNGLLVGRGVRDDKGPVVAGLAAMSFFKECGIQLPFGVRLIMGCSEEKGMEDLPYYIAKGYPVPKFSFTPDSAFPVCRGEKGIASFNVIFENYGSAILSFKGGNVTNAVADYAEIVLDLPEDTACPEAEGIEVCGADGKLCIKAKGLSSHAAMPEGSVNAIVKLAKYVLDAGLITDYDSKKVMRYIVKSNLDNAGTGLGIACSDELTGALTCICGMGRIERNKLIVNHNVRYPVNRDFAFELLPKVRCVCEGYEAHVELAEDSKGYAFPADAPEISALTEAFTEITGVKAEPYTMGGGTYARAFPNTVAFGAAMSEDETPFGTTRGNAHQNDECIPLDELLTAAKIFALSLMKLAELQ
ncbi:MAG: Sapep family Mn(2+)-dependent dipeptidase [Clostridia bacterium]|nr:Sapep family Mn(2+)-dependent dipeptidase [Clostridia bacterium]